LNEGLISPTFISAQSSISQKKEQRPYPLAFTTDELAHIEKDRLEKIAKIVPLFLTMKEALHLLL
jgi:hypothetical protein